MPGPTTLPRPQTRVSRAVRNAAVIWLAMVSAAQARSALETRARTAVAAGEFAEARLLYRRLAAATPTHAGHRLWVARLSGWLGEYDTAERAYVRVLATEPDNVEARLGQARVATWSGRYDAAERLLAQVAVLEPTHPELEMARRRNDQARAWEPVTRHQGDFELTLGFGYEDFSFASAATVAFLRGAWRGTDFHPWLQIERWDKFDETSTRAGLGTTWRPLPRWSVAGEVWIDPGSEVLAEQEFRLGMGRSLPFGIGVGVDYRYMHFDRSTVHVGTGIVEYYFPIPIWVSASYHRSWTAYDGARDDASNDSLSLLYHQQLTRRLRAHLGYAYGTESFHSLSVDRLGDFSAHSGSVGLDVEVHRAVSIGIGTSYQSRDNGTEVIGFLGQASWFF